MQSRPVVMLVKRPDGASPTQAMLIFDISLPMRCTSKRLLPTWSRLWRVGRSSARASQYCILHSFCRRQARLVRCGSETCHLPPTWRCFKPAILSGCANFQDPTGNSPLDGRGALSRHMSMAPVATMALKRGRLPGMPRRQAQPAGRLQQNRWCWISAQAAMDSTK